MAAASVLPVTPVPATMPTAKPAQKITLLVTTFPGLGLPRTLSIPVSPTTSTSDALASVHARLPSSEIGHSLLVSTTSGKILRESDEEPITTLLSGLTADFLPLRINARLCGGKGGFGSQLRAAGGRMSSRKNRDRQDQNGSNRNLDGRRLRTVDQAKRLAEYLASKPEMDQKEKEEKRKRWEEVIASAEATEEKIKAGKVGSNQGRLDAEYVESKEVAEEKVREAVAKAMREQVLVDGPTGSESSAEERGSQDEEGEDESSSGQEEAAGPSKDAGSRSFFGWDDDDEFLSDDDEEADKLAAETEEPADVSSKGKGKTRAS